MNQSQSMTFEKFFEDATGNPPFHFQKKFAEELHPLVNVPTGLGKTAMAIVGWLWRRHAAGETLRAETPRRLVYCLPMRVLVEQTRDNARAWIKKAGCHDVRVHVLMGGEEKDKEHEWDIHPERDAIIIGTQDMLLSRALNRGYAASRARWPMQFGLLHTDCVWVFDEIQLMGSGLATTAQLEAFRRLLPNAENSLATSSQGCRSVWMSATMREDWLQTVDFERYLGELSKLELTPEDALPGGIVEKRQQATKPLEEAKASSGDPKKLANEIVVTHRAGTLTIAVVNTVDRARELYQAIQAELEGPKKGGKKKKQAEEESEAAGDKPQVILLHSRFRPPDREKKMKEVVAGAKATSGAGTIVVSTQVIEAGVDLDATTLFTEVAPWSSLVQRFGRCNRKGEKNDSARVYWIDVEDKHAAPYDKDQLDIARELLKKQKDVGIASLPDADLPFEHTHVIRRRDLLDLFDTTSDLAGNDIDIDRFVREIEETDVRVYWREWTQTKGEPKPPDDRSWRRVGRDELCSVPAGQFRDFLKNLKENKNKVWRWDYLEEKWDRVNDDSIYPGQVFLLNAELGGYSENTGWSKDEKDPVAALGPIESSWLSDTSYGDDGLSMTDSFECIKEHTDKVYKELEAILRDLPVEDVQQALLHAARWHDWGKGHTAFQAMIDDGQLLEKKDKEGNPQYRKPRDGTWEKYKNCRVVAKAPGQRRDRDGQVQDEGYWRRGLSLKDGVRNLFRHELASALGVLHPANTAIPDESRDLIAYLVAAHHGKVRLSIRSMPNEARPRDEDGKRVDGRFARGVWEGDELPAVDLGGGVTAPTLKLSLEPMEIGLCEEEPFKEQPSWIERMLRLRDTLGPFRLAYLEALLRAADMRASKANTKEKE